MVLTFHLKCTVKCCLQFVSIWTRLKILTSGKELNQSGRLEWFDSPGFQLQIACGSNNPIIKGVSLLVVSSELHRAPEVLNGEQTSTNQFSQLSPTFVRGRSLT